jgi:hypothetical protein
MILVDHLTGAKYLWSTCSLKRLICGFLPDANQFAPSSGHLSQLTANSAACIGGQPRELTYLHQRF